MSDNIHIKFDGEFDIAIGRSRKEINWKNKHITWSDFLNRIKDTHRTHETFTQYIGMSKPMQSDIKDIGGFVGGFIAGGRRKIENVSHRQLVTLDIDFGTMEIWENFKLLGFAGAIYSTHKHSPSNPRLRLIVPLDREVSREEYEPISRYIANEYGINAFDDTTFDVCRLMYWPSSPKDGEYIFEYSDGEWMSADDILNSYTDWTDASSWPVSERIDKAVRSEIKKQEIPTEKKGIVGAFCRTYSVTEAIEKFLTDEYESCDVENRYTYKHGSTAAGLVVYDDLFAFSHHGTDPSSGKLCNAFDLVRIHKFGIKDDGVHEKTNTSKYPSFMAMEELATKDKATKMTIAREKAEEVDRDFGDIEFEEEYSDDWLGDLDVDKKGNYLSTSKNIKMIMENDPFIKGCFARDTFADRRILTRMPPWRKKGDSSPFLRDSDESNLRLFLSDPPYEIQARSTISDVLDSIVEDNAFHSVKDFLEKVNWDGVSRLDSLFIDYLGAADTELNRAMTRKAFVAAVSRIFHPGSKFDEMIVLVGKQGCGKSTIIGKMGKDWFSNTFISPENIKSAAEQIQGSWLIEIGELNGFRKAENTAIKDFLSKTIDDYRPAYGKNKVYRPRQCIFFGTTNEESFLRDPTGDRRFWPIKVATNNPKKDVWDDLDSEVDQIWAEAVHFYRKREPLTLSTKLNAELAKVQELHKESDDRWGIFLEMLDRPVAKGMESIDSDRVFDFNDVSFIAEPGTVLIQETCAAEIATSILSMNRNYLDTRNTKFIHEGLRASGKWEEVGRRKTKKYGWQKIYRRIGV